MSYDWKITYVIEDVDMNRICERIGIVGVKVCVFF